MKAKKFTFKTVKPTGRYKAFEVNQNFIKLDGKKVGNTLTQGSYKVA